MGLDPCRRSRNQGLNLNRSRHGCGLCDVRCVDGKQQVLGFRVHPTGQSSSWTHDSRGFWIIPVCLKLHLNTPHTHTGGMALRDLVLRSQVSNAHACILISPFRTLQVPQAGLWTLFRLYNIDFTAEGLGFYAP